MGQPRREPPGLRDFKAKHIQVSVTKAPDDPADTEATRFLLESYSDSTGFHCPVCKATITDIEEAIHHIAEEINKAMTSLDK
jgi:hypothetical protein